MRAAVAAPRPGSPWLLPAPGRPAGRRRLAVRFESWPIVWLWPAALLFMQVPLLRLQSFEVTIGVLACHALQLFLIVRYWLHLPSTRQVVVYLGILLYALLLGLLAHDAHEFLRSMAHVTNLVLMIAICMNVRLRHIRDVRRSLVVFCALAAAAATVVIVQALMLNLWGEPGAVRLLGDWSPRVAPWHDRIYAPDPLAPLKRANGWFSEPSVAGWFFTFAASLALAVRHLRPRLMIAVALLCLAGAVATLSLTGILGAVAVILAHLVFVRESRAFRLVWAVLALLALITIVQMVSGLGIASRIDELSTPGTSGYLRLSAPFTLVSESLISHPLGYPLGQTDLIAAKRYFASWRHEARTNVDNSWFLVILHFGLLGVLFSTAILVRSARLLMVERRPSGLLMLAIIVMLAATGAGWAHQSVLLIGYAVLAGRYLNARDQARQALARQAAVIIRPPTTGPPELARLRAARPPAVAPLGGAAP
jgi:hypothetical protein